MPKRIIILEKQDGPQIEFRFALWASVPAARQPFYANVEARSEYKDATGTEIADLQAGRVVEKVATGAWSPGTSISTITADLVKLWTAYQAEIDGKLTWQRYGTFWDGTSWTNTGVA